ncbi:MAG: Amidohydrolase 1 [Pedobacter sp.]|jgi:cytosine/adenosine deaminase-related metal-dependent hydrolase|nr:Amidohydrolase 1 [Pedobacter sp.]
MLTYLSASKIYPVTSAAIDQGVLAIDPVGVIAAIYTAAQAEALKIKPDAVYQGSLIPGLINTHCHLELSHLKGRIEPHTGLLNFVSEVMKTRDTDEAQILEAMFAADEEMYENGIVAVGDISNVVASKAVKLKSQIHYHTFIEAMGFNPRNAKEIFQKALELKQEFLPLLASIVPHAPYSVSDPLMALITGLHTSSDNLLSIHNQETAAENEFFQSKTGGFLNLYDFLGLNLSFYEAPGVSSLQATLPKLPATKVLLVHNTQTTTADLEFAEKQHKELYWCLCPNANQYIENKLPDVQLFQEAGLKITLGTDSLASNHQLNILKEMQTLQEHKQVGFETLLGWATINGASFLGINAQYGSFEVGKSPGILLLEKLDQEIITDKSKIRRLY